MARRKTVPGAMGQICRPGCLQMHLSCHPGSHPSPPPPLSNGTARFPPEMPLLCRLLPGSVGSTVKKAASLSHPCLYNPILLWEYLWSNKRKACPTGPEEPDVLFRGEANLPPPCPVLKTHYGYEVISAYCYAG